VEESCRSKIGNMYPEPKSDEPESGGVIKGCVLEQKEVNSEWMSGREY